MTRAHNVVREFVITVPAPVWALLGMSPQTE